MHNTTCSLRALLAGSVASAVLALALAAPGAARELPTIPVETAPATPAAPPPSSSPASPVAGPPAEMPPFVPGGMSLPLSGASVGRGAIADERAGTADTAALLARAPGVSLYANGGVSGLPALNGLNDDRINTRVDGMPITGSCPNHMNPPLSYIDPANVGRIDVMAGITPVSMGGDSIAGTVSVTSAPPVFARAGEGYHAEGKASMFYRSNGNGLTVSGDVSGASENVSLRYVGAFNRADDYQAGGGQKIRSTDYNIQNHAVTLAGQVDGQRLTVQAGMQYIPYQGFPNQRMDMTNNRGVFVNGHYEGRFDWGDIDARAYWQHITHEMNFLNDKGGTGTGGMPMNTQATDSGFALRGEIPVAKDHTLRVGNEYHHYHLDDWWPPVAGAMMMGPQTYWNINNGHRDRLGTFAEWEARWAPAWTTLLGARNDIVWMDTGNVQPYSWQNPIGMGMMRMANPDAPAATAFNAQNRARTDVNFDVTALARYAPTGYGQYELGFARKTRSPNLYERYAWGTGSMSSSMIGWFGDANGYVGNLALKPETANTVGVTGAWGEGPGKSWNVKITPYYSRVQNFIDVKKVANLSNGFVQLQFTNVQAELYGVNMTGDAKLWEDQAIGRFSVGGVLGFVQGRNLSGGSLYHMMPINATIDLEHTLGGWRNVLEFQLAGRKSDVEAVRNEPQTPSYALVNLRSRYQWDNVRVDFAIENLFDQRYYLPLGGVDYADFKANGSRQPIGALPGLGRSFNLGLTVSF